MKIIGVRHDYPERKGFKIHRPVGRKDYTFLHFEQEITIEMNGQKIITKPNACLLYSPDTPQLFYSNDIDIIHNWMHFTADAKDLIKKFDIPENQIVYPKDYKFISRIFYKMETEFNTDNIFKNELLTSYFKEFLIRFSRSLKFNSPYIHISSKEIEKFKEIRKLALSTPEQNWTIENLAKKVSLSPSRFHSVYKSVFGISPIKDIIENRIQTAKNLLVATNFSVVEISEKLGYLSVNHFIRQFKSIEKQTPLNYRQTHS